jgi:hypothetical protein
MEKTEVHYKYFQLNGSGAYGNGRFDLPKPGEVGEWLPEVKAVMCQSGYHFVKRDDLLYHMSDTLCEVEVAAPYLYKDHKGCASSIRILRIVDTWNECTARLFACDCAERVLPIFERKYPDDKRVHNCIRIARGFAYGEVTEDELNAAADAANAAAYAANAAYAAAADAAYAAAYAAKAAYAAERQWQLEHLLTMLFPKE